MKDINVTMLLIALGLSFLALPLGCPSKLMFKEPLNNVTVKVGQDAVFHCVVKDLGGHRVAWNEVESKAILAIHTHVVTSDSRVKVSHDRALEIWTLKIRNVSLEDSGSYMCQLNTNPMRSQKAYLNVVIPPTLRSREIPEESVVSEGGPAELRCMAEGIPRPDIIWTREDGGPIVIRRDSSVQKFENFIGDTLHMPRVTRWDMGNYICTAKNGVEPTPRERITLHVRFPPLVRAPDPLIRVIPGGSFSAHCQVESFPASLNYWLDPEGKTVNNHGNRIRTSQEFEPPFKTTFSLSIENVTRADFGTYHCVSNNGQSKEVKSPITVEAWRGENGSGSPPDSHTHPLIYTHVQI
ncbi:unnamed protein product [Cyprideis torosa]|uniref:Uncharacterized protein n=1 Tax=Cyprideis torosa TaxID=163714 RepID=A0A7R8WA80_9CRUS|nr:unnamed protein product [Cyprideis torosa]CAG0890708.1 unnamed protein product [Cyprideis torosa]